MRSTAKILILFSDTGGGHRAAAEALRDAIDRKFGDQYGTVIEDGIVHGAIPPLNQIPKLYRPLTTFSPRGWGFLFDATNSRAGGKVLNAIAKLVAGRGLWRMLQRHNPDLVVTVHPLLTRRAWRELKKLKPSALFVTVVTDLFDAHIAWFSAPADLLIVPSEGARARALRWGFPAERMRVVGLPVSHKFAALDRGASPDIRNVRRELGLQEDVFTILIVGGGEGMGPIEEIARGLADAGLALQLAVIAGRNQVLRKKLENAKWQVPVRVTGFVTNMPDWLRAADLVITKAGPGTIMETLAAGRPLLLSGYLPGQERGNVDFVLQSGVGVLAEQPAEIVSQVRQWLSPGDESLDRMRERARAEARPDAADKIADLLDETLRKMAAK